MSTTWWISQMDGTPQTNSTRSITHLHLHPNAHQYFGDEHNRKHEHEAREQNLAAAETSDPSSSGGSSGRRPRGRPRGSKNKPKSPVYIARETPNALRGHILEITNGSNIIACLVGYAHRCQRTVTILSSIGFVTDPIFEHSTSLGTRNTLFGTYQILSLSGAFVPTAGPTRDAIVLECVPAGNCHPVEGGTVVGSLLASGTVVVTVATFTNQNIQRLPAEDETAGFNTGAGGTGNSPASQSPDCMAEPGPSAPLYSSQPFSNFQAPVNRHGNHHHHYHPLQRPPF